MFNCTDTSSTDLTVAPPGTSPLKTSGPKVWCFQAVAINAQKLKKYLSRIQTLPSFLWATVCGDAVSSSNHGTGQGPQRRVSSAVVGGRPPPRPTTRPSSLHGAQLAEGPWCFPGLPCLLLSVCWIPVLLSCSRSLFTGGLVEPETLGLQALGGDS